LPTNRFITRRLPQLLVGTSGFFLLTIVVETVVGLRYHGLGDGFAVSLLISLPFVFGITYGGRWLAGGDVEPERYHRIATWTVGGCAVFAAITVLLMTVVPPANLFATLIWIRWAASIGAGTGLLLGVFEARAIDRRVTAERARIRAEEAESRRELLDYLNGLLRHEVLNSANVIVGRSGQVIQRSTLEPAGRKDLDTIQRRARDLADVIEDARVLLQATTGDGHRERLDVVDVLERELEALSDYDRSVTIETDLPASAPVLADSLLPRIFSNLLTNAVEHHDGTNPTVRVTVETTTNTVQIHIADDGPGVPAVERQTLFECDDTNRDHGLGLSLVATLVERYAGSLELTETGPSGSVFTVELPLARDETNFTTGERLEKPSERTVAMNGVEGLPNHPELP
jgi:signal transduction histidine kinase